MVTTKILYDYIYYTSALNSIYVLECTGMQQSLCNKLAQIKDKKFNNKIFQFFKRTKPFQRHQS
jgi:hypothetical protein